MKYPYHDVIVIGTSAGGIEALQTVVASLPASLPAAVLVVLHQGPTSSTQTLVGMLQKRTQLRCEIPTSGDSIQPGIIYLAPANHHMLVQEEEILLTDGPKENNYRPAVDALFRSAAVNYGSRLIGLILTGMLQDGVAGMEAIKRCGGICLVQHPDEAQFDGMPRSVINNLTVDDQVPLSRMGQALENCVYQPVSHQPPVPEDLKIEAQIAQRYLKMNSDETLMDQLGQRMSFSCPNCGGGIWKMKHGQLERYRCHIGHSYSAESIYRENTQHIEESLWVALRMLEDRKFMLASTEQHLQTQGLIAQATETDRRRAELDMHVHRLKSLIQTLNSSSLDEPKEKGQEGETY